MTPPVPEPVTIVKEDHTAPTSTQLPTNPEQSTSPIPAPPVSGVVQDANPRVAPQRAESNSEDLYGTSSVNTQSAEATTRVEQEEVPAASSSESAEEEKKRLEREEMERVLAGGAGATTENEAEELPPYQEIQE